MFASPHCATAYIKPGNDGFVTVLRLYQSNPQVYDAIIVSTVGAEDAEVLSAFAAHAVDVVMDTQPFAVGYLSGMMAASILMIQTHPTELVIATGAAALTNVSATYRKCEIQQKGWQLCSREPDALIDDAFRSSLIVNVGVRALFYILTSVSLVMTIGIALLICIRRSARVFQAASVTFCVIFLCRCRACATDSLFGVSRKDKRQPLAR